VSSDRHCNHQLRARTRSGTWDAQAM